MYFVGIDVGGTKSDFLLCDENECEINRVILGAGNPNDIGIEATLALLGEGLDRLCGGIAPDAVFAGISGGGYGENACKINEFLKNRFPNSIVENGPDALNLIYCSKSANAGALICGTGSLLFLRVGGRLLRFGGWGHLFDDGGSGYDIGRDALRYLLDCEERAPHLLSTPLCSLLRERLSSSAHDAISKLYAGGKTHIASFAPLVVDLAARGETEALKILKRTAERLAYLINKAADTRRFGDIVIIAGGLTARRDVIEPLLKVNINGSLKIVFADRAPIIGAAIKCLSLYCEDADLDAVRKRIDKELFV